MGLAATAPRNLSQSLAASEEFPELVWHVGGVGVLTGAGSDETCTSFVTAGRAVEIGEVVDACPCLIFGADDLKHSFLLAYCYELRSSVVAADTSSPVLLLPLGWGLMLGRDSPGRANLCVEHEIVSSMTQFAARNEVPCGETHWLSFRAIVPIAVGAPLVAAVGCQGHAQLPLSHVFTSALSAFGLHGLLLNPPSKDEDPLVLDTAPTEVRRRGVDSADTFLGDSAVHRLGVFASHDLHAGDVVEFVPVLPLWHREARGNILQDYVFASDLSSRAPSCDRKVVHLPLGFGGLYNHSTSVPNVYAMRFRNQPFVEAWVAQDFVPAGAELFLSYGQGYWSAPWRRGAEVERPSCTGSLLRYFGLGEGEASSNGDQSDSASE
eukprot:TRINITY_DN71371_c0_g1_i1.p1 TRINITY_DN71371_c0_g1~~TRINITY_DN71371_c0_g1_i1.p1  ORF type:complete len:380 (+),score=32.42 TRINITY_DN71371_c0_g1_i1:81-1220(+)